MWYHEVLVWSGLKCGVVCFHEAGDCSLVVCVFFKQKTAYEI